MGGLEAGGGGKVGMRMAGGGEKIEEKEAEKMKERSGGWGPAAVLT